MSTCTYVDVTNIEVLLFLVHSVSNSYLLATMWTSSEVSQVVTKSGDVIRHFEVSIRGTDSDFLFTW